MIPLFWDAKLEPLDRVRRLLRVLLILEGVTRSCALYALASAD
jgi:hypothetical protein